MIDHYSFDRSSIDVPRFLTVHVNGISTKIDTASDQPPPIAGETSPIVQKSHSHAEGPFSFKATSRCHASHLPHLPRLNGKPETPHGAKIPQTE